MGAHDPSRALYYALDAAPRCLFELRRSIASVRRYCRSLPIYVALAGTLETEDTRFLDEHGVTRLPMVPAAGMAPMFMKWQALTHAFAERDVLFLDTDTVALGDISQLFELQGNEDFHARPELACDPDPGHYPHLVNMWVIPDSQIDHQLMRTLCDRLGSGVLPVFSTGSMLLRNGLAARLASRWEDIERLHRLFVRKELPYPCRNPHILEEVVATLVLGQMAPLTWHLLPPAASLTFPEYMQREAATPLVLHTGSMFYRAYLCGAGDADGMRAYNALPDKRVRRRTRDTLLPLGSTRLPVPQRALEKWVSRGVTRFRTLGN